MKKDAARMSAWTTNCLPSMDANLPLDGSPQNKTGISSRGNSELPVGRNSAFFNLISLSGRPESISSKALSGHTWISRENPLISLRSAFSP